MGRPSKLTLAEFVRSPIRVKAPIYARVMRKAAENQMEIVQAAEEYTGLSCNVSNCYLCAKRGEAK